jgi:hypothetical protein
MADVQSTSPKPCVLRLPLVVLCRPPLHTFTDSHIWHRLQYLVNVYSPSINPTIQSSFISGSHQLVLHTTASYTNYRRYLISFFTLPEDSLYQFVQTLDVSVRRCDPEDHRKLGRAGETGCRFQRRVCLCYLCIPQCPEPTAGTSGAIYKAEHMVTKQVAAVKVQHVDDDCPTNRCETSCTGLLDNSDPCHSSYERGFYPSLQGGKGMPLLHASGVQGQLDYLVMELLGPSLDNLYRKNNKQVFDLKSVCCVAIQIVSAKFPYAVWHVLNNIR